MIVVVVLVWAGLVSLVATRALPRARWVYRSPGLGLCAWWAVVAVTVSAPVSAAVMLLRWSGGRSMVCGWWMWCVRAASGQHGVLGRWLAVLIGAVAVVAGVRAVRAGWRAARALAGCRRRYASAVAGGQDRPDLGAVVVDDPVPAAFVVPGRPGAVVVTSGALRVLPGEQVAAVLAHEYAHAAGHHQLLADTARLLCAAFPRVAVLTLAWRQVDRLLELRADDVAAGRHARLDLARALVTMAQPAGPPVGPVAAGAVAVTGGDALERVRRLLQPPPALPAPVLLGAGAALVALAATPAALTVAAALFPVLLSCPPVG